METTTAASVASNTTTGTTAGYTSSSTTSATTSTTQSSTTSTTQSTTSATTAAETTTAATYETYKYVCEDGEFSYEFALALFDAQNALRAEIGLDDFIWDDEMYEVAQKCAKICGDNEEINHDFTKQYRYNILRTNARGDTILIDYTENLQCTGTPTALDSTLSRSGLYDQATTWLSYIKRSAGHYKQIQNSDLKYTAIAAYRKGTTMYVSYIFYVGDDYYNDSFYDASEDVWYDYADFE